MVHESYLEYVSKGYPSVDSLFDVFLEKEGSEMFFHIYRRYNNSDMKE